MKIPLQNLQKHLTPETAAQHGFQFIGDIIFNPGNPSIEIDDHLQELILAGFKIGQPKNPLENQKFRGLYRPIV